MTERDGRSVRILAGTELQRTLAGVSAADPALGLHARAVLSSERIRGCSSSGS